MGLPFCEKCDNIMVLKKNLGKTGKYICRSCGFNKKMPLERIEIKEEVKMTPIKSTEIFDKRELI